MARPKKSDAPACPSGSIEQHLDMCESGPNRGDEIQFTHGRDDEEEPETAEERELAEAGVKDATQMLDDMSMEMSEENREGDELSGEHEPVDEGVPPERQQIALEEVPGPPADIPGRQSEGSFTKNTKSARSP